MTSCLLSFAQPASKRKWGEKATHCSVHWLGTEHSICIVWIVAWSFGPCTRSSIFRASGSGPFVGPYYAALFIEDRDRPATFPCAQSQNTETWPVVVTVNGSFLVVQDTWMNKWTNELINSNNIPRSRMYCTETENDFTTYFEWYCATRRHFVQSIAEQIE